MIRFNITVDHDLLEQLANRMPGLFGQGVASATSAAFNKSAVYIRKVWQGWATGGPLMGIKNIKSPSTNLFNSIYIEEHGPFDVSIQTNSPHAHRIQEGIPRLDMKTTHPYRKQSRITKSGPNKGKPYLIVPFRWGTPNDAGGARAHFGNTIPQSMYHAITAFKVVKSIRLKETYDEENYAGQLVQRSKYDWGERLEADGNMNGMVRMKNETKRGGSTYFTFRIISAAQRITKPNSWIRKEVKGVDVVSAVIRTARPVVDDVIQAGIEADLRS